MLLSVGYLFPTMERTNSSHLEKPMAMVLAVTVTPFLRWNSVRKTWNTGVKHYTGKIVVTVQLTVL